MSAHRNHMGLALRLALGSALLASPLFMSDLAQADESQFAVSSEAAPAEEDESKLVTWQSAYCSASGFTPTGRQNALITVSPRDPSICVRTKLGGTADPRLPDCWQARAQLGCFTIVDLN